jgi:hypothetical protein
VRSDLALSHSNTTIKGRRALARSTPPSVCQVTRYHARLDDCLSHSGAASGLLRAISRRRCFQLATCWIFRPDERPHSSSGGK